MDGHSDGDIRAYLEARTSSPSGWSPDGEQLLVATDLPGTSQAYRLDLDGGSLPRPARELVALTDFADPVSAAYLPADPQGRGRRRLLLAVDRGGDERHQLYAADDGGGPAATSPDELEAVAVAPDFIHRPGGVTRDGRRLAYATNRRDESVFEVWVRDLAAGHERAMYACGGWSSPAGFSPDGRLLAVSDLTTRPGDNRLHLVDLEAVGQDPAAPATPAVAEVAPHRTSAQVGAPAWLPDCSAFFFATDVGSDQVGIARGTPEGSWRYVFEPGWEADCTVDWSGRHLLVTWNAEGVTHAELRDPQTLALVDRVPLPGDGVAAGFSFTRDGRHLAFGFSSATVPGDVWRYDTAARELDRLTVSPSDLDAARLVPPELVRLPSFDGLDIPAFVFHPRAASGPSPVVVIIHGGPESQYRPSFAPLTQYLVARGFAVVAPNVRGSTGYGRSYQHLDDVERRLDAVRDLGAVHDWLATQPHLDETRAALYGGSYGGYMVLAGLALQPHRWAAGVDVVGMSNLVTFLQRTAPYRRRYREREYGSLDRHRAVLEQASPITHVAKMRAPLFIVHGANDPRVPLSEARQIHAELTGRGVRCELAVYDDEGHGLSKLANRMDCYPRVARFLGDVLQP